MSPNNLIVVLHFNQGYFVLPNLDADEEWNIRACIKIVEKGEARCWRRRSAALVRAHDLQKKLKTEYGVRELVCRQRRRQAQRSGYGAEER